MKTHFVTGATGFVGSYLVRALLKRGDKVLILIRPKNGQNPNDRLNQIFADIDIRQRQKLVLVEGDITKKSLGMNQAKLKLLKKEKIEFYWHLAADLSMNHTGSSSNRFKCNVIGTKNVVEIANYLNCQLCHFSTLHVSGRTKVFSEFDFDINQKFRNPYERTKFLAEKIVRSNCKIPYIIFRPGSILGHAPQEKASDCTMGYYRFAFLFYFLRSWIVNDMDSNKVASLLFKIFGGRVDKKNKAIWFSRLILPYPKGVTQNVVPVDYVIKTAIKIALNKACYNLTFHLTHPKAPEFVYFVKCLFSDLSIKGIKFVPIPAMSIDVFFRIIYILALPYRGYIKSALIYVSYITFNDKFLRSNADKFNAPPASIRRSYVKAINKYAFEKVFPQIKLKT